MNNSVVRNDDAASTVQATNGQESKIATDEQGRLFVRTTPALAKSGELAAVDVDLAAYATLITNTEKGLILDIYNGTDRDIIVSVDGTNPFLYIPTLIGKVIHLGNVGKHISSNVSVKALTADATTGSVLGTLIY